MHWCRGISERHPSMPVPQDRLESFPHQAFLHTPPSSSSWAQRDATSTWFCRLSCPFLLPPLWALGLTTLSPAVLAACWGISPSLVLSGLGWPALLVKWIPSLLSSCWLSKGTVSFLIVETCQQQLCNRLLVSTKSLPRTTERDGLHPPTVLGLHVNPTGLLPQTIQDKAPLHVMSLSGAETSKPQ